MSELARRVEQCKKPTGELGKFVVDDMNNHHYQLTSWGLEKIEFHENDIILDIGCGGGRTINRLSSKAPQGKIYGIDYSLDCVNWSIEFNKELVEAHRVEVINASVEKLPFDQNMFDIITAVETIYFWPNLIENLREVKRVLKSSGRLVIINELYLSDLFKEKNEKLNALGSMVIYSPIELREILMKAGFSNIKMEFVEERNWMRCICEK